MKRIVSSLFEICFPRTCAACHNVLETHENQICFRCLSQLPHTGFHLMADNKTELHLRTLFPLVRATGLFFFRKDSPFQKILHALKYEGQQGVGEMIGEMIGLQLQESTDFKDIDCIIPVPLHPSKLRQRGYNQSECIANGIARKMPIPIDTKSLIRTKANKTQTKKSAEERQENVQGIFALSSAQNIAGKHILLVDDVLTTGATISACANELLKVEGVRISIAVGAIADN